MSSQKTTPSFPHPVHLSGGTHGISGHTSPLSTATPMEEFSMFSQARRWDAVSFSAAWSSPTPSLPAAGGATMSPASPFPRTFFATCLLFDVDLVRAGLGLGFNFASERLALDVLTPSDDLSLAVEDTGNAGSGDGPWRPNTPSSHIWYRSGTGKDARPRKAACDHHALLRLCTVPPPF